MITRNRLYTVPKCKTYDNEAYAWYKGTMKSPRFIMAPMVDQSELAFRVLVKKNGCDLAFTQMHHAYNFMNDPKYRATCIDWVDYAPYNGRDPIEAAASEALDKPLIAQFAGSDPDVVVQAAQHVQREVAACDLNLGCPQKIAKRGNYGAFLLPQTDQVIKVLSAMVENLDVPVTAKIRKLGSDKDTLDLVRRIEACGVSMVTVHGRTVDSSKLYTGAADWDIIKKIKDSVGIPVVANGGIETYADAVRCLEYTGCDAVMSSEALLENPKLFSPEGDADFHNTYIRSQLQTVREYLSLVDLHAPPRPYFQVVRSHLFRMLYRFMAGPVNRDLRALLAEGHHKEIAQVVEALEHRAAALDYDMDKAMEEGFVNRTSWYRRHRGEGSEDRRTSNRRRYRAQHPAAWKGNQPVDPKALRERMNNLKERLKQKHIQV